MPRPALPLARVLLAALALGLHTPAALPAQTALGVAEAPSRGGWQGAVDRSRDVIMEHMREGGIPGVSVAVAVGGRVVWAEGFGWADVENKVGVTPETRFRIASISKALTAGALATLMESGAVDLDAPVQRYVPRFPEKPEGMVTTRLLAGHLAGVRHYRGMEFASQAHYDDVVDALEIFADDPLQSPPGQRYAYSTYGWNLISAVVQGASGVRFLTYVRDRVLKPLGMDATVAEHGDSIILSRGRQYQRSEDGRLVNAPWVDNSNKWAGGGYLSTASDLVRYGSAYLSPGFLRPETVQTLWTSQKNLAGEDVGYGIGWFTGVREGTPHVWHTGGAVGGSTMLLIRPDAGVVVAVLTNLEGGRPTGPAFDIAGIFAQARP
jgi:CubicO group peptidase (beta-lactamase class C family)